MRLLLLSEGGGKLLDKMYSIVCLMIYYVSGNWLENFYYRINPGVLTFVIGFSISLVIAIATISYRILRAARVNPASSLKYE